MAWLVPTLRESEPDRATSGSLPVPVRKPSTSDHLRPAPMIHIEVLMPWPKWVATSSPKGRPLRSSSRLTTSACSGAALKGSAALASAPSVPSNQ